MGAEQIPAVEGGEVENQPEEDAESGVDEPPDEPDIDQELEEFRELWKEELTGDGNDRDGEEETSQIELEVC